MKRSLYCSVGCIVLFGALCFSQEDKAVLTGTATDPSHAVIVGAEIDISNPTTGFLRKVNTNESGSYYVGGIPIGDYIVAVEKVGFTPETINSLRLTVGQTRTLNIEMQIASTSQQVTVEAAGAALQESSAEVGGVISDVEVSNLPLNGRNWTSLMGLVPGAIDSGGANQNSIRFAGRGNDDNNYRYDGVDATGISHQGQNASVRLQISTEAISEFRVDSLLYSAESGGTPGGQIDVVTKSGSNEFHGGIFEYLRNDKLDARTPFDPSTLPPLRLNQFGGDLGGPIVKNRTFFFASYEGLRQQLGQTLIGFVPTDSFRAAALAKSPGLAPLLTAYPEGNGAVFSNGVLNPNVAQLTSQARQSANEDSGLIRVDHRFSDSDTLLGRYNIDEALLSAPAGSLRDLSQTTTSPMNGTVQYIHIFSAKMLNELQLGVNRVLAVNHTESGLFNTSKIFNSLSVPGFTKLNQLADSVGAPTSYSVLDNWTLTRGQHTIKAGVEVKKVNYDYSQASENALVYSSLDAFAANQLNQVNLIGGVPMHGLHKMMYFGYAQDQWKAEQNLTITMGLRYEFFNRFHEIYGRDIPFDLTTCGGPCPTGSEFSYPVTHNLEPRLSIAWAPERFHGKTVIRTGAGLYKGEGQLGDLNAPSDNYTQRLTLSSVNFPTLAFPADPFLSLASNQAVTPRALQRDRQDPTVAQWGLQIQTTLPGQFVLDTGYIGSSGYHQFTRTYVNVINPLTRVRPIPGYGQIDTKDANSNTSFNAWQTSLNRQFRSGWTFAANYMWSHSLNDGSVGGGEAGYPENVACRACEWASSDQDVRHTLTADTVYQLPFGRGRRFLNSGGVSDALLGGWEVTGVGTFRSGLPVNVTLTRPSTSVPDGNSDEHSSSPVQRPDLVPGASIVPSGGQTINNWINFAAFTTPANGTWGNAGRNLARGPNLWQADIGLTKRWLLTERFALNFRAEAFNVFNRAQFGNPNGDLSTGQFGRITTTVNPGATGSGTPRQFQFSLRMSF